MAGPATIERPVNNKRDVDDTYNSIWTEFAEHNEERKSFDPLASVRKFRYDLHNYGRILPETRAQVQDEELSLISEGLGRASRTSFVLLREGKDLAYFDRGDWRSYEAMLLEGREVANAEAIADPRRQFLSDDAMNDLAHYLQVRKLQPGQQYIWHSKYRKDVENMYGKEFMGACGRFADRQMGFIYRASCEDNGNVLLESQTIDHAIYDDAFAAVERAAEQHKDLDSAVAAYDEVVSQKLATEVYAGRTEADANENVWRDMLAHEDLIRFFLHKLEAIAAMPIHDDALEEATKRHMYGVWAAFKKRVSGDTVQLYQTPAGGVSVAQLTMLDQEVHDAFTDFAEKGFAMIGCGGKIEVTRGVKDILSADVNDIYQSIFGDKVETDRMGSLKFKCTKGHTNERERNKTIEKCRVAGCSGKVCAPKSKEKDS